MLLKKISYLLLSTSLFLFSCTKDDPGYSNQLQNPSPKETKTQVEDRSTCASKIRINSVSPANARWALQVSESITGNPLFLSSSIPINCGLNLENNLLNTWYDINIPSGSTIKVQLGSMVTKGCMPLPNGATLSYTIQAPSGSYGTFPYSGSYTRVLTWNNGLPVSNNFCHVQNNCTMADITFE
jgi:hypothetical protein